MVPVLTPLVVRTGSAGARKGAGACGWKTGTSRFRILQEKTDHQNCLVVTGQVGVDSRTTTTSGQAKVGNWLAVRYPKQKASSWSRSGRGRQRAGSEVQSQEAEP